MICSKRIALKVAGLLITLMAVPSNPCSAQDNSKLLKARIEDAKVLIAQQKAFELHANQFHAKAEAEIQDAKRLSGQAQKLQQGLMQKGKLDGTRLKAATAQYTSDLSAFKLHAGAYDQHLQKFRSEIGECHSNENEFKANLEHFTLHVSQYHLPNIQPPHICGAMDVGQGEAQHLANRMMFDRVRMAQAEAQLRATENKLQGALVQEPALQAKAMSDNRRSLEEQSLAGEFARLADEYKTLEIERQYLTGNSKVAVSDVHAKLKLKK